MLASVAASPVSRPGPWHARVQPASEPVFQPLMAWLVFYCCARVGFACRCVSFLWLSVSLIRTALLLVLPCLCVSVFIQKGLKIRVPCVCALDRTVFLSGYPSCFFWVSVSLFSDTCLPPVHISLRVSFLSPLLSSPGPKFLSRNLLLWLRMSLLLQKVFESLVVLVLWWEL